MATEPNKQHWWQTLPGILTAVAGLITAITGLIIAMDQFGKGQDNKQETYISSAEKTNATTSKAPLQQPTQPDVSAREEPASKPKDSLRQNNAPNPANRINLFAPENGAELLISSHDGWLATIDGKEEWTQIDYGLGKEAVYGFGDNKTVSFDTFTMLIAETEGYNIKEFEILVSNDSPTGSFNSIGKFKTQNAKMVKSPYQEFTFPAVQAKYVKIKILKLHDDIWPHPAIYEFQLFGRYI